MFSYVVQHTYRVLIITPPFTGWVERDMVMGTIGSVKNTLIDAISVMGMRYDITFEYNILCKWFIVSLFSFLSKFIVASLGLYLLSLSKQQTVQ